MDSIYLGPQCMEIIKQIPQNESERIRLDCLQFYIVAREQIQKRLPINPQSIFNEMLFLNPKTALCLDEIRKDTEMFCFKKIGEKLQIDENKISVEWRIFANQFFDVEKTIYSEYSVDYFWLTESKIKNFNDKLIFPELSKVAFYILLLPYANADAERIFYIVSDVKNKKTK